MHKVGRTSGRYHSRIEAGTPPTPAQPDQGPDRRNYLLLLENDLNRVFNQSLGSVAAAELSGVTNALLAPEHRPTELTVASLGRASGLSFRCRADRAELEQLIGRLSCASLLFEQLPRSTEPDDREEAPILVPHPLDDQLVYGTQLVSVQRYRGKTNERLTRAMLNLALAHAELGLRAPWSNTPTVLDPMCGRGTTLNWALCYGLHAIGIEADGAALRHYDGFLRTWAKQHRLPHRHTGFRANNAEHRHMTLEVAPTRAEQKAGAGQRVATFNADGGDRSLPIKRGSIDVIVCDLPYGVQHRADPARHDPTGTGELVERLAPTWRRWLRRGGAACLAWNVRRLSRADLSSALADGGLVEPVATTDLIHSMEHVVDSTITRDVIVVMAG